MLGFGLYVNLLLALFNLLPIPPLDGGRVLMGLLPPRQAYTLSRIEPFGFLLVIVLIYFTGLWKAVIAPMVNFLLVIFAGQQVVVVEQAMRFLFGR
jgi:Zn-dependent protease